jgi:hypothetical protein
LRIKFKKEKKTNWLKLLKFWNLGPLKFLFGFGSKEKKNGLRKLTCAWFWALVTRKKIV